ncbi:MAG: MscL family protein [Nitrososphaerota archaeon]|jgi:large conductance mechanosensitive channel protein|nr:MscL family protein [Nitrososphaerota archaeon]
MVIILVSDEEILTELRKIREAVEKTPPPPPPPKPTLWGEFKEFLSKYKIFGLAIAFIIGMYLGGLVQALVKDFLLPAIGLLIPGLDNLAEGTVTVESQIFAYGDFLVALFTFALVALLVFLAVKIAKHWGVE